MADPRTCETCGLAVPADTDVCPRDGTVLLGASVPVYSSDGARPDGVRPTSQAKSVLVDEDFAAEDALVGMKLGEYELRQRIGVGGMGLVYDGIQPLIGKRVAVKVLRPELAAAPEQVARLLAEARAVNAIRHRGIIDIFGFGQVPDGRQYIVMEYLEGQALDGYLAQKGRLPVPEVLDILDEVLSALGAAHGAGVVHRDLKPSNIFLVQQPDGSRYVKLLDFGLAKQGHSPSGRTAQTRTDMVVGTPEYMAPEQARGQPVGPMTDLYALGVVAFEMLTGQLPFTGSSPVDLLMKHVDARPPRPSEFVPELPPALDAFILQMLTKDPEARPGSAEGLRRQLQRLRETLLRSRPQATTVREPPVPPKDARDDLAGPASQPAPPPPEPSPEPITDEVQRVAPVRSPAQRLLPLGLGAAALGAAVVLVLALRGQAPSSGETPTPSTPPRVVVTPPPPVQPPRPEPQPVSPPPVAPTPQPLQGSTTAGGTDPAGTPPALRDPPPGDPGTTVLAVAQGSSQTTKSTAQKPRSHIPTQKELRRHLKAIQDRSARPGAIEASKLQSAFKSLNDLEKRIDDATTPQLRLEVKGGLDYWERLYLKSPE